MTVKTVKGFIHVILIRHSTVNASMVGCKLPALMIVVGVMTTGQLQSARKGIEPGQQLLFRLQALQKRVERKSFGQHVTPLLSH